MKKQILFLAILSFVYLNAFSQIIFEKGYFIDESDHKIDCLIKNVDWQLSPTGFQYKLTEDGEVHNATIQTIKEFRVGGSSKYIRANAKIDRSPSDLSNLTTDRNPLFKEELVFLKVVVDGKATLYSYEDNTGTWFFYKTPNKEISPLVYKMYQTNGKTLQNNAFKQELSQNLICKSLDQDDFENINYYESQLQKLFTRYNKCSDPNYISNTTIKKKGLFNLTIRPGVSFNSLSVENSMLSYVDTEFETNSGFRFGIETEFIFPFNKNKWALLIEPTYQSFSSEQSKNTNDPSYGVIVTTLDYQSVELPIGARYYFFLKKDSQIFLNALGVFDFSINSTIKFKRGNGSDLHSPLKVSSGLFPAVGIGYKVKNKLSVEARYQMNHDILSDYSVWQTDYSSALIIVGYSF